MKSSTLAKVGAWAQFGLGLAGQLFANGTAPHGLFGWLALAGQALAAVGIHAAASTDGTH